MTTAHDIEQALFALAPRDLALDWDNVGLLAGDPCREVTGILVALDVTEQVLQEAAEQDCSLIVTHHPLMNVRWQSQQMQTLREDRPLGRLLRQLVRAELAVISMHTNLDKAQGGVNDILAQTLGLADIRPLDQDAEGFCRFGTLPAPLPIADFARQVRRCLGAAGVRWSGTGLSQRIAVGSGACGGCIPAVIDSGCDTFVTADLTYHQFLEAPAQGLKLIDAGHFPTEDPVCRHLAAHLSAAFPALKVVKSQRHRDVIEYDS